MSSTTGRPSPGLIFGRALGAGIGSGGAGLVAFVAGILEPLLAAGIAFGGGFVGGALGTCLGHWLDDEPVRLQVAQKQEFKEAVLFGLVLSAPLTAVLLGLWGGAEVEVQSEVAFATKAHAWSTVLSVSAFSGLIAGAAGGVLSTLQADLQRFVLKAHSDQETELDKKLDSFGDAVVRRIKDE